LLQEDIIEKLGGITSAAIMNPRDAQSELARRVSGKLGADTEVVQRRIGELIAKGVLQLESRGNGLRWQWTDTRKLKLASGIMPAISRQA
jgi:hypothetical protein